jgi:hypothetical protein
MLNSLLLHLSLSHSLRVRLVRLLDLSLSHSLRVRLLDISFRYIMRVRMLSLSHILRVRIWSLRHSLPVMLSLRLRVFQVSLLMLWKRWRWNKLCWTVRRRVVVLIGGMCGKIPTNGCLCRKCFLADRQTR